MVAATSGHSTESAQGLLRINYNRLAGAHLDNSYVTLTGSGNVTGALEFAEEPGGDGPAEADSEAPQCFVPCEHFLDKTYAEPVFFLFVGVKVGGANTPIYRPLSHRVVPRPPSSNHASDRINIIYFIRKFSAAAHTGSAPSLTGDLEINVNKECLVRQMALTVWPLCDPPTSDDLPREAPMLTLEQPSTDHDEAEYFDWGADGLDEI